MFLRQISFWISFWSKARRGFKGRKKVLEDVSRMRHVTRMYLSIRPLLRVHPKAMDMEAAPAGMMVALAVKEATVD